MNTIHKYPLQEVKEQQLSLPQFAQILDVQYQGEVLTLWASVNTKNMAEGRIIEIYGTGSQFQPRSRRHLATVQKDGYVWHVFEITNS